MYGIYGLLQTDTLDQAPQSVDVRAIKRGGIANMRTLREAHT